MGKHRKPAKKWGRYVTTGVALEVATLFAFAYATDSHVPGASLLAQTSIFVDGTKSILGNEEGVPFYRMADSFQGAYSGANYDEKFVIYPRSLGPLTGLGDPTYDDSEAEATREIVSAVEAAKNDPAYNGETVYVVGYSQGAGAGANAIPILEERGLNDNVVFVLASNPRRNDGGILTRLPAGVYVPVLGVSFGGGTTAEETKVLQVTKQYDGVADSPDYIFNVAADPNAILGYYYLHSGYYKDVPAVPENIDPNNPPEGMIVSTNENGNVTDVVLVAPEGELPLTMPLLQLFVPKDVVVALDPFLRSVIETGYDRPVGPGAYPDEPVPFRLVPPPDQWASDVQSVAAGAALTTQRLAALGPPSLPGLTSTESREARLPEESPAPLLKQPAAPGDQSPPADIDERPTLTPLRDAFGLGTGPNKVEPPKRPAGGWQPGDLVRSVLNPKSSTAAGGTVPDPLGAVRNALSSLSKPDTDGSTNSSTTGSTSPSA